MSCSTCIACTVQICTRVEGAAVPVLFVLFRYVQELRELQYLYCLYCSDMYKSWASCSTCIVCTVQICTRVEGAAVPVLFVLFRYVQELQ